MSKFRVFWATLITIGIAFSILVDYRDDHLVIGDFSDLLLAASGIIMVVFLVFIVWAVQGTEKHFESDSQPHWRLSLKRVLAANVCFFLPRYGRCSRCWMPWAIALPKVTEVNEFLGAKKAAVFCLCVPCWNELAPEGRFVYYSEMYGKLVALGWIQGTNIPRYENSNGTPVNIDWIALKKLILYEGREETEFEDKHAA